MPLINFSIVEPEYLCTSDPDRAFPTTEDVMTDQPPQKRQRVDTAEEVSVDGDVAGENAAIKVASKDELMPPCPKVPPVASTERKVKRDGGWRWAPQHGMDPPQPVYGPKDTTLWPEEAAELFRATKTNRDPKYASKYMRWWFENHEGMPARVPKIPHSAYSMYYVEQKAVIFQSQGKFHQKKDGQKIGASWKRLEEEEKRPYMDKFAALKAEREENEEWWDKRMSAWREERMEKLRSGGVELDPLKRRSAGLEPLCECAKCGPIPGNTVDIGQK